MPKMLSDHAVLQRRGPIHIWGWATPGAKLTVKLHAQNVATSVDRLGEWTAWLMPEEAGGPFTLTIAGDGETKTLNDLLIGDVWLASGQSNMEMPLKGFMPGAPLKNSAKEIAAATNPQLRLLLVDHRTSDYPLDDTTTTWTTCTPETAANFSAAAYFFGREIAAKEHVAIGLIDATWGGTPADSWVSMEAFGADANLVPAFASRAHFAANIAHADAMQKGRAARHRCREGSGTARAQLYVASRPWLMAAFGALQRDDCAAYELLASGISLVPG